MQILQNVMGYFHHLPPKKSTKTLGSAAAMARPPGWVRDGVSWPEVVALQAQVKSKELWSFFFCHSGTILQSMELVRYRWI